jgi:hypothetical protein
MPTLPQRWLSLSGICTVLNLTPSQIKTLYNQKLLVRIGKNHSEHRYLDPTPEYAERLRLAAIMLSKNSQVNIDLPLTFLLTIREVAEIMGWTQQKTIHFMEDHKVPCYKSANRARLYSVAVVRDMLWRRNGRKLSKQLAPMMLPELIAFFRKFQAAEEAIVPTDAAFAEDADVQKKVRWIMRQSSPQREVLLADFVEKLELAKQVVSSLQSRTVPQASPTQNP